MVQKQIALGIMFNIFLALQGTIFVKPCKQVLLWSAWPWVLSTGRQAGAWRALFSLIVAPTQYFPLRLDEKINISTSALHGYDRVDVYTSHWMTDNPSYPPTARPAPLPQRQYFTHNALQFPERRMVLNGALGSISLGTYIFLVLVFMMERYEEGVT